MTFKPWITAGLAALVLGVGTAFALTPKELLKARKAPPSGVALALPMAEHPPDYCDPARAGWMYMDIDHRGGGAPACVCVQDKDLTWHWASFAGDSRECD